jgi:hypothetical protein
MCCRQWCVVRLSLAASSGSLRALLCGPKCADLFDRRTGGTDRGPEACANRASGRAVVSAADCTRGALLESIISSITIVAIASRAVNIPVVGRCRLQNVAERFVTLARCQNWEESRHLWNCGEPDVKGTEGGLKTLIFRVHRTEPVFPCEREWAPARVVALRLWLRPLPERRLRFTPFVPPFLAPTDCELGAVAGNLSKLTGQRNPGLDTVPTARQNRFEPAHPHPRR